MFSLTLLAVALLVGCSTPPPHGERYPEYRAMRSELAPLDLSDPPPAPTIAEYYGQILEAPVEATYTVGTVAALGERTAVHLFEPSIDEPRGTVYVLHGYLAHALQFRTIIRRMLLEGFVVVAPELPGHGLSDGERGGIDRFESYGTWLDQVFTALEGYVPHPVHLIAHSTGATATFEFIRQYRDPFEAVVFVAPLVRSAFWNVSRVTRTLTRPLMRTVGTRFDDPLGVSRMPLSWFDALTAWNNRNESFERLERPILVLQGTNDRVVDWRYNGEYLRDHVSRVEFRYYEDAGHVLYLEQPPIRQQVLDDTAEYILAHTDR